MNDTVKKLTGGQKFMAELENAAQSKEDMLRLAGETIRKSHSKRTFVERDLPVHETALNMRATYAAMNAYTRKDLSTDQRLILIKQKYQKLGFGDFDKDFKKAYPDEYGLKQHIAMSRAMINNRKQALGL